MKAKTIVLAVVLLCAGALAGCVTRGGTGTGTTPTTYSGSKSSSIVLESSAGRAAATSSAAHDAVIRGH